MKVRITKKDIIWSYLAQFLNLGAGMITLPLVLHMLSAEEIGMNYLMITVSTMVGLLDFGFAPQFARNITYVFSGVHTLQKEGVAVAYEEVDYELLKNMIGVAKMVYTRLALVSLCIMLTAGSWYIHRVTDGFTNVPNSFFIWIVYSVSVYFNVYFFYYTSLLMGRGGVKESKMAMIAQKLTSILLTYTLLFLGAGLLGVVISNLISPFVGRYLSHRFFYDAELKDKLVNVAESKQKRNELFFTIWYNAKKLGLVFLGAYAVNKLGMFIAGLFLSLDEIASYGLMLQLFSIIASVSMTFNGASQPLFAAYRTEGNSQALIKRFAFTMNVFYILFITGTICLILLGPWFLNVISSNAALPSEIVLVVYALVLILENNHAAFSTFIVTENKIPFVKSSLIAGTGICLLTFVSLKFTALGILGIVMSQGLCQAVYANWKWPYVVCKQFNISFFSFLKIGVKESVMELKILLSEKS